MTLIIKSLQDLANQHATALGRVTELASWALDNIKGFPSKESISKDDLEQLELGYRSKYAQLNPPVDYVIIEGNHMRVSDCETQGIKIPAKAERVKYGVDFAFSFNSNEVGRLKDTHGEFIYNLVATDKGIRSKCNKYVSNTLNKLLAEGLAISNLRKGITVVRKPNLDIDMWLYDDKGPIKAMQQRVKNGLAKKTVSTDMAKRIENAILAFNVAFKK
jgi:hypothetical protein